MAGKSFVTSGSAVMLAVRSEIQALILGSTNSTTIVSIFDASNSSTTGDLRMKSYDEKAGIMVFNEPVVFKNLTVRYDGGTGPFHAVIA